MSSETTPYNWQPLPEETGRHIETLSEEAIGGGATQVAQRANTIFSSPRSLLVGELVRISGSEVIFHTESLLDTSETLEQFMEYESIYDKPSIIGRFMGCVALRETSGVEELGCEVSVQTETGDFLSAHIPLSGAQIEVDASVVEYGEDGQVLDDEAAVEAEAAENERQLGKSFRYLRKRLAEDGQEALAELENLIYNDVDVSAAESEAAAVGFHIRAIGVCSAELLNRTEVAEDEGALRSLQFILEANILEIGESYDLIGQTSDTVLKDGLLFAENVAEVRLEDVIFSGVKLFSAAFDIMDDKKVYADGTCVPALQFEVADTGEIYDIQLLRIAQVASTAFTEYDEPHDSWRQRYDKYIQDQGR